jgi:glycosyltransferase involved in cell wall biosynthesis
MFIDAATKVLREIPRARFLVVGKGSLASSLADYAAKQGLSKEIMFLGHRPDIAQILAATDISALSTDFEGLPNVIIESMAAGKPIVCTNYPGYQEILTHESNALISPCGNVDAFAENLLRLIRNGPLRTQLGSQASAYAKSHFAPEAMAKKLELIYSRVPRIDLKSTS